MTDVSMSAYHAFRSQRAYRVSLKLLWCGVCAMLLACCTIRSGEHVASLRDDQGFVTAVAVRFVNSEGIQRRRIDGLRPQTTYQVTVQAQVQQGVLVLRGADAQILAVRPGAVRVTTVQTQSDADGAVVIEESTQNVQGGEYQMQFVADNPPS